MQKRFLYIAIRKYDFVEKRAGKAREQKSGKARERKPEKRASGNQKSAQAEKRKTLTFQPLQDKIIEQIIL